MKKLLGVSMMTLLMIVATAAYSEEKEVPQLIDYFPLHTVNSCSYIRAEEPWRIVRNWA